MKPPILLLTLVGLVSSTISPGSRIRKAPKDSKDFLPIVNMEYIVYPTDSANRTEISNTEAFLKTISSTVTPVFGDETVVSWSITLIDEDNVGFLKEHTGVKDVRHLNMKQNDNPQRRDAMNRPIWWLAVPSNPEDEQETNKTRAWLGENVEDKSLYIVEVRAQMKGKVKMWGSLTFTDDKLEEAKKHPGIAVIERDFPTEPGIALPHPKSNLGSRAELSWLKQVDPPHDLALDSQYKDSKLEDEFVYEERAGEGIFMYVIDLGINMHVKHFDDPTGREEFKNYIVNDPGNGEDFQTSGSKEANPPQDPNDDSDPDYRGHGTMVASKALGLKYGIAKKATLISVKVVENSASIQEAFELILDDLNDLHPERVGKSVVLISRHVAEQYSSLQAAKDSVIGGACHSMFEDIINLGVPIVCSANNHAGPPLNREVIDTIPPILDSEEAPLIVVGAATEDGKRAEYSQGEGQVTIYAPGTVKTHIKTDGQEAEVQGTSFAAPVVAGIIATYMNYDPPPWDTQKVKTGKDRVVALRDWLRTDATSGIRGKQRMIWNGADENAHKNAQVGPCKRDGTNCSPDGAYITALDCIGIQTNHYMTGETASMAIDQWFCPDAANQGRPDDNSNSITRTYLQDTMETIELAIDWPGNQPEFTLQEEDCRQYMHKLLDKCDLPTDDLPMHWKAGGSVHVDPGKAVYRWSTLVQRQPPMPAPRGHCQRTFEGGPESTSKDQYIIVGAGWLNTGGVAPLEAKLKEKGMDIAHSEFRYHLDSDGNEWEYVFDTPNYERSDDVGAAIAEAANYPGFAVKCN